MGAVYGGSAVDNLSRRSLELAERPLRAARPGQQKLGVFPLVAVAVPAGPGVVTDVDLRQWQLDVLGEVGQLS